MDTLASYIYPLLPDMCIYLFVSTTNQMKTREAFRINLNYNKWQNISLIT